MNTSPGIRTGQSCAPDPLAAAREFHEAVSQPDQAVVFCFCSGDYDLEAIGGDLSDCFADVPVVGCTTAGEIGPLGWLDHSICGVGLSRRVCTAVVGCLDELRHFDAARGHTFATSLLDELLNRDPNATPLNTFAFLLFDPSSGREDHVARELQSALGNIRFVGGGAGNGTRWTGTRVYCDGCFRPDAAVLVLVSTYLPFRAFMTHHFVCDVERVVVTNANAADRLVYEINGRPAVEEYARLAGVDSGPLAADRLAIGPLMVRVGGVDYVRSIQEVLPDGSLRFFSAIDEGLVLRLGRSANMVDNIEQALSRIQHEIGPPLAVLGCDCVLRGIEATRTGVRGKIEAAMRRCNVVGFGTYGEQYQGVHVDHTFVGLALGAPPEGTDA